jgi:hypothetical protein
VEHRGEATAFLGEGIHPDRVANASGRANPAHGIARVRGTRQVGADPDDDVMP